MKIFVTVKQVPDTSGTVAVHADGTLDRASMNTITNPDDMNAVEAALQLKELTGCEVVAVTMGPPKAESMLRELMARGVDKSILISSREFGGSDTYATSQIIAATINLYGLDEDDLILAGQQAIDGDTAQVGPQLAEKLGIPQVTYAAEIVKDGESYIVKRMLEEELMSIKVHAPCLITCTKELNSPRFMSVEGIYGTYQKPVLVYDYNQLHEEGMLDKDVVGLQGSPTNIYKSFTPPTKGVGIMLTGTDKEMAEKIAHLMFEKNLI